MPGAKATLTYSSLAAPYDNINAHYAARCVQCSFAGGEWSQVATTLAVAGKVNPVVAVVAGKVNPVVEVVSASAQHYCHFTGALETDAKLTGAHAKPAVVEADLKYEHMFDRFTTCHHKGSVTKADQLKLYSAANKANLASMA
jgi:hypothetical protein